MIACCIIGAACALYGTFVFLAGYGTWFFAFWYVAAFAVVGLGWLAHSGVLSALPSPVKIAGAIVAGALVVCLCVTLALQLREFGDEGEPGLDCIIVLGAFVRDEGPSSVLRYRLDAACDYLAENEKTICIVSGGQGYNEPFAEADVMADYLIGKGVDPARIIRERESTSTFENLKNSLALAGDAKSIGIVTNNFHVFRSLALARKLGVEHPSGIATPSNPAFLPNNMMRESMVIVKDFLAGNM